jgi:hypothetical protein
MQVVQEVGSVKHLVGCGENAEWKDECNMSEVVNLL